MPNATRTSRVGIQRSSGDRSLVKYHGRALMTRTYRATVLTGKGGPEMLQVKELPLQEPKQDEVRVRVAASGVGSTDIIMRRGSYTYVAEDPLHARLRGGGDRRCAGSGRRNASRSGSASRRWPSTAVTGRSSFERRRSLSRCRTAWTMRTLSRDPQLRHRIPDDRASREGECWSDRAR